MLNSMGGGILINIQISAVLLRRPFVITMVDCQYSQMRFYYSVTIRIGIEANLLSDMTGQDELS